MRKERERRKNTRRACGAVGRHFVAGVSGRWKPGASFSPPSGDDDGDGEGVEGDTGDEDMMS